ncbi:MAG: recombinase family protein [Chitinophagales bacterium]|nr:recombinase family protein [Chitinophagales bacterium]
MKNIYAYIRVSTVKQGDGVSLEVQKRDIERFAQQKNLNIVEWFEEQKSASKGFRPKFNQMIEQLYSKKADGFVAHKIDRMMRNRHDWAIINELIDEGCEVLSADGTTLDDVNGRFMGDIQAAVATRYSHNLSQEAKKGLYGRLAQGIMPFKAPVGYLNNGQGKLKTIDPLKVHLIQELFSLYIKGDSVLILVDKIYQLGLRNNREKRLDKNGIISILRNPFYTGIIKIKGQLFKGNHEPIISMTTYKKAQEVLDGKVNARLIKNDFLFRRMISCANCGYKLIGERQKGNIYYRCHTKTCPTATIRESVIQLCIRFLFDTVSINDTEMSFMETILNETTIDLKTKQKEALQALSLKRFALKAKQDRITTLVIDGTIDQETYQKERNNILTEIQLLDEQEVNISAQSGTYHEEVLKILEQAKTPYYIYENAIIEDKREMLKYITSNLVLEGKKLVFTMVSPFLELSNRSIFSLCGHTQDTPLQMESNLVRIDPSEPPIPQEPLSEEGCQNLIHYLIEQHFNINNKP